MPAEWNASRTVILLLPAGAMVVAVLLWLVLRRTIRSRYRMEKQLREDPDINEWLVVFGWSRKVLYVPTIAASVLAAVLVAICPSWSRIVGGVWFGIFFLNFLVDEYEISVKVLLIAVLCMCVVFLWLHLLGWLGGFFRLLGRLDVELNWAAYLLLAGVMLLAVAISWIRGLYYYVAITPNYMNIQVGPTETGEQISRENYSTRIDTGDFLERLLGFGRIIITFSDQRRQPMMLLIRSVGKKAAKLESIRGKLAVDRLQPSREDSTGP